MSEMNNWLTQAVQKLKDGKKAVGGQKEKIMAPLVAEALEEFCRQDQEFAQAVVQGGSFADCMKAVANGVGNSISDLSAYKKAVEFYFKGAKVRMQLTIDVNGTYSEETPVSERKAAISLNLEDFL